ncbi:transcriptional regulator, LuxR family (plasmid) [Phenylobacterium zucineum HLK1]|uniref:Transcriptional regulator, LuxR family n=1 Tax=Phenylobacterium zucineum (strain HLK1) TaxID=450851 RepID=B4RHX3_PHEZH|nr:MULTISPECIES: LuxR family transcriptional regulator [Phenylobacterium]ACG79948.1 transcriptional regulator, LuxR family [Phenylobacterium zucineum HLK1]MBJ7409362.1 autoinducer binding domain-containing protein [Phenylobacterium sp.]
MLRPEHDIARRAFDTINDAQQVESIPELEAVFAKTLEPLGVDVFVGVQIADPLRERHVEVTFGRTHAAWQAHYEAQGHAARDPIVREMLRSTEPLFWSDLPARRGALKPDEARVMEEARSFGLNEGLMTPLHHVDGSVSAVLMMGERLASDAPDTRAALHLLSIYYGSLARKLRQRNDGGEPQKAKLSARQIECLRWAREGKSSYVIGQILSLSARTVDEHLASACRKLGVHTRMQAVAQALLLGLLETTTP